MAPSHHFPKTSECLRSIRNPKSSKICLRCQVRCFACTRKLRFSTSTNRPFPARRDVGDDDFEGTFAGKVRKRIWGTQDPPGQQNPYVRTTAEEQDESLLEEEEEELIRREQAEIRQLGVANAELSMADEEVEEAEGASDGELMDQSVTDFTPATTWKRLRSIRDSTIIEQIMKSDFKGFIPSIPLVLPTDIEGAIHRAVVEIWTLKKASGSLQMPKSSEALPEALLISLRMDSRFKVIGEGQHELEYKDQNLEDSILRSLGYTVTDSTEMTPMVNRRGSEKPLVQVDERYLIGDRPFDGDEAGEEVTGESRHGLPLDDLAVNNMESSFNSSEQIGIEDPDATTGRNVLEGQLSHRPGLNFDKSWRNVALDDSAVKFAVVRRVMQLTGIRLSDPEIQRINTAKDLLASVTKPPKHKKLAPILLESENLKALPNVQLHEGRWSFNDKEREIGREKLIRKELARRGLPFDMKEVKQIKRF